MTTSQVPAPGSAPERQGVVLAALIGVAAVANLNLAVANVALPDIGKAFDASQTGLDLVAVGYSLGLGPLPGGARRPLRPQDDAAARHRPRHPGVDPRGTCADGRRSLRGAPN